MVVRCEVAWAHITAVVKQSVDLMAASVVVDSTNLTVITMVVLALALEDAAATSTISEATV